MRSAIANALRNVALALEGVEEGIACEGTALEKRTVKVGKKAFLFLGARDALLKLGASLPAASKLGAKTPERFRVGANGWVKITFDAREPPPLALVAAWIAESYALAAGQASSKGPASEKTAVPKKLAASSAEKTSAAKPKGTKAKSTKAKAAVERPKAKGEKLEKRG